MNREEYIGILETENAKLKQSNKNLLESIKDSSNHYQELLLRSGKYLKKIEKANKEIQKLIDKSNDTIINPMWNYIDVIRKLEIIQDELIGGSDKE